jgi:hypothetical protein
MGSEQIVHVLFYEKTAVHGVLRNLCLEKLANSAAANGDYPRADPGLTCRQNANWS